MFTHLQILIFLLLEPKVSLLDVPVLTVIAVGLDPLSAFVFQKRWSMLHGLLNLARWCI